MFILSVAGFGFAVAALTLGEPAGPMRYLAKVRDSSILENNIGQTGASAAGTLSAAAPPPHSLIRLQLNSRR